ncbi:MAG: hypothetical protein AB1921_08955 [Thermodesulfobacteriota bacterium]
MKRFVLLALAIVLLVLPSLSPAWAGVLREEDEEDSDYTAADQAEDDRFLESEDLARIAFVKKNERGQDVVFIRIPPAMYRLATARSRVKRRGVVRVKLRPRHYQALEAAIGQRPRKVILRISANRMRKPGGGLTGHYVVRPVSQFSREDASDTSDDPPEE